MAEPDIAIQALLNGLVSGPTTLTAATKTFPPYDGNIVLGAETDEAEGAPSTARVFVVCTGGPLNARFLGTSSDHRVENVQVMVVSDAYDRAGGLALARACQAALHCPAVLPTGYYNCTINNPQPVAAGEDEQHHHHFSINVDLRRVT